MIKSPFKTLVFATIIVTLLVFSIFKKNYLQPQLAGVVTSYNGGFRPDAYVFFHSPDDYGRFLRLNSETEEMGRHLPASSTLDFEKYSYCITFGRKVSAMYFSAKTTWLNDPSPGYASARRYGKHYVMLSYDTTSTDTGAYLYRVGRNERLRGSDGL